MSQERKNKKPLPLLLAGGVLLTLAALFFTLVLPELRREERTLVVPIHVVGTPAHHVISYQSHTEAQVKIKATPEEFKAPDLFRLQVRIPSENPQAESVYPVEVAAQHTSRFRIQSITPPEIHLRLTRTASRIVPVEPKITGTPAPGFRVKGVIVTPATTHLTAPLKKVHTFESISTTAVSVEGARESVETTVAAESKSDETTTLDPAIFKVHVAIEEEPVTLELPPMAIEATGSKGKNVTVSPTHVHLKVSGPQSAMAKLKPLDEVRITIDTHGLEPGVHVRRAAITLPDGITLSSASPELFTVTIAPAP